MVEITESLKDLIDILIGLGQSTEIIQSVVSKLKSEAKMDCMIIYLTALKNYSTEDILEAATKIGNL